MSNINSSNDGFAASGIKTIWVGGMSCNHCKANVENSVRSARGVEDVTVDLITGQVNITGDSVSIDEIKAGIEGIGYSIIDKK